MTKEEFELRYKGVIPKGVLKQVKLHLDTTKPDNLHHDTTHDVSFFDEATNKAYRLGTFQHSYFAGYTEDLLNAYRNGELVWATTETKVV